MVHVTTVLAIVTRLKKMEKLSVVITVIKLAIYHIVVFMQTIRKGAVVTANVSIKFVNVRRDSMANTAARNSAQQIVTVTASAVTMACVSVMSVSVARPVTSNTVHQSTALAMACAMLLK
jgi:hypothetical protein